MAAQVEFAKKAAALKAAAKKTSFKPPLSRRAAKPKRKPLPDNTAARAVVSNVAAQPPPSFENMSLEEFRQRNGLSVNVFKRLRKEGRGPAIMNFADGRISYSAESEWRQRMLDEASVTVNLRDPKQRHKLKRHEARA